MLQRLIYAGLGFLYPPHCVLCQVALPNRPGLCLTCAKMAGCASPEGVTSVVIDEVQIFVLKEFNDSVRQLIHLLKYRGKTLPGRLLGCALGRALSHHITDTHDWVVVPVALHRARQRERGYNQSAVIAKALAKEMGIEVYDKALKRIRYTPSQTHLDRQARYENVASVFKVCHPQKIVGRSVILVDDVITTGATGLACVRALIKAGAECVVIGAVSRPQLGDDDVIEKTDMAV